MAADFRPACANDVDALVSMENAVFETDRLSRRALRRLIASPSATVLIAEMAGAVAAYCILLFRTNSAVARLYSLAVTSQHAGRGLGRALLGAAEQDAVLRGRRLLRLEVRADNARAVALYQKAGFRLIGNTPGYYGDGMSALRMEKDLDPESKAVAQGIGVSRATEGSSGRFP